MAFSTSRRRRADLALTGVLVSGLLSVTADAQEAPPCRVDWQHGVLTVSAFEASRAGCLEAVAQRTGLKVSGLAQVRGAVTLTMSSPMIGEIVRRLAGDISYTLVENDADHPGDPRTLSVRFAGVGSGVDAQPPRDIMRDQHGPVALVENPDTGVLEAPAPRRALSPGNQAADARPDSARDVEVQLEN